MRSTRWLVSSNFYSDDDFMIKINYMGYGCGSCIDAFEKINKEIIDD